MLLHNDSAGSEDHTDEQLVRGLRRGGHRVVAVVESIDRLTAELQKQECDLVAIAGGDGTVGRTASELAGWGVPLAILPLGTANNTARCLGVSRKLREAVADWSRSRPRRFDLAFLSDGAVRLRFSEAAGWGLFPAVIANARRLSKPDQPHRTIKRDRRLFLRALEHKRSAYYQLEIDGRDYSGEYLLLEVANIGLIGPRLEVSGGSDPGDGQLEVVMARESDRENLIHLVNEGRPARALHIERGVQIKLSSSDGSYHRDGGLVRLPPGARDFRIDVEPAAVTYLAP
ncbi:MAG: diacylglycerol/lipid kinase family protein [Myxococcota bacterium]